MAYLGNLPQGITQGDVENLFIQSQVLLSTIILDFLIVNKIRHILYHTLPILDKTQQVNCLK